MIATNRDYLRLRSNIALKNLAMLHKSFDGIEEEGIVISLALNDSIAATLFSDDQSRSLAISQAIIDRYPGTSYPILIAGHEKIVARCYMNSTKYAEARKHLLRAESLALTEVPPTGEALALQADILHDLAMNSHHADEPVEVAIGYLQRAIALLEPTAYSNRKGVNLMGIGNVMYEQHKYDEALKYYQLAVPLFDETENVTNLSCVLGNMGMCYIAAGQAEQAEECLMRALDMRTRMGSHSDIANNYYHLSHLHTLKGDPAKAYEMMCISRDYVMASRIIGQQILILNELRALAIDRGDTATAELCRRQLEKIARANS